MSIDWGAYFEHFSPWMLVSIVLYGAAIGGIWWHGVDRDSYFKRRTDEYEKQIRDAELSRLRARDRSHGRGFTGNR